MKQSQWGILKINLIIFNEIFLRLTSSESQEIQAEGDDECHQAVAENVRGEERGKV